MQATLNVSRELDLHVSTSHFKTVNEPSVAVVAVHLYTDGNFTTVDMSLEQARRLYTALGQTIQDALEGKPTLAERDHTQPLEQPPAVTEAEYRAAKAVLQRNCTDDEVDAAGDVIDAYEAQR